MQFMLKPCHILLAALVGGENELQQQIIEFQSDLRQFTVQPDIGNTEVAPHWTLCASPGG